MQTRGCTQIVVRLRHYKIHSRHGCGKKNFGPGLFVVQLPATQCENLAAHLERCLILADRPETSIFVGWYAHTKTRWISGVQVQPKKPTQRGTKLSNGRGPTSVFKLAPFSGSSYWAPMKKAWSWDLCAAMYTKIETDSYTVLTASKNPTQFHPNKTDLSAMLPLLKTVSWVLKTQKCNAIVKNTSAFNVLESPSGIAEKGYERSSSSRAFQQSIGKPSFGNQSRRFLLGTAKGSPPYSFLQRRPKNGSRRYFPTHTFSSKCLFKTSIFARKNPSGSSSG